MTGRPGDGLRGNPWPLLWRVAWAPALVLATHVVLDRGLHVYDMRPWLDGPMHLLGGLAVAFAIATTLDTLGEGTSRGLMRTQIVTGTVTVAVLWEFLEYGVDYVAGTNLQVSLANTMKDLAVGLLGAVLLAAAWKRRGPPCV